MARQGSEATRRIGWIDVARALGACAIVLLHVFVSTTRAADLGTSQQVAYAVVSIVGCRWAVPAFFMLTGVLMLDPNREVGYDTVLRHVKRMLAVIAIFGTTFSLMEEVWQRLATGLPLDLSVVLMAVVDVLTMRTWDHLWFIYALVGVYATVPIVRWVQECYGDTVYCGITLALFVLVLGIPTVLKGTMASGPISSFFWNMAIGITCCCIGGCLRKFELSPIWAALGLGSMFIMVVVSTAGIGAGVGDQGYIFLQGSCFASLQAIFFLMLLRWWIGDVPVDAAPVKELARDSFGIYLVHPLFIHLGIIAMGEPLLVPVLYEVLFFAFALAASVVATRVMRRLPVLKNLL